MFEHLIPSRRQLPGDDPIFLANAEANRRKAVGEEVLNATIGALLDDAGSLVILETVMDLWRELTPSEVAPYAPIAGDPAFLKALVQRHWPKAESFGCACATPGGSGALMVSLKNFLEPGMTLLTAAPYWGPYHTIATENFMSLTTAPYPAPGEALDADAWEKTGRDLMAKQGRILLWLNDPCHNPTGQSLPQADRLALFAVLRRLADLGPVVLLADCAYLDYTSDPAHVREALDAYAELGAEGKVLVGASLSLSKALTLYGGRGGALAFPWTSAPELQAALAVSCRGVYSNCARGPQSVMVRLAKDGKAQERLAAEHRHWSSVLAARTTALDQALKAEGLPPAPWKGGFFVTIRHPQATDLNERLKAQGVFAVPMPEGIRVGICGLRAQDAPRFARALKQAW